MCVRERECVCVFSAHVHTNTWLRSANTYLRLRAVSAWLFLSARARDLAPSVCIRLSCSSSIEITDL